MKPPSKYWIRKAKKTFKCFNRDYPESIPNIHILEQFHRDGLSARHSGKLMAYLCEVDRTKSTKGFEYWKV